MRIRGAAEIGRQAARALMEMARHQVPTHDEADHGAFLDAGRRLIAARPTAVTLRNAVNLSLDGIRRETGEAIADRVESNAAAFVDASVEATARVAVEGAKLLPDEAAVLTHCHSSLAVAVLVEAQRSGKRLRVFADETRPWLQGHITARQLHEAGVDVTLIVDSAAHHVMRTERIDAIVIGADTVTHDGALYNKVGTHAVALGAASLDIPVHCASGIHKFSPYSRSEGPPMVEERSRDEVVDPTTSAARGLDGVPVRNPVFDRTEGALIEHYVTERGLVPPTQVEATIRDAFGHMEGWI